MIKAVALTFVLLLGWLLSRACHDDGSTTTREARNLIGEEFPFLFSIPGYEAERHSHRGAESQLLVLEGMLVFVRRANARPSTAAVLRKSILRAAQRAHFKLADEELTITTSPPESERGWISAAGTALLEVTRLEKGHGGDLTHYECRFWIAADASRFVVAYLYVT